MPSYEEKAIYRQKKYIGEKFQRVRDEIECVISLFQSCLEIFDCRVEEVVKSNGECFLALYRKLNNEFEEFQEKLMYVQASIEVPSKCQNFSDKVSLNKEDSNQSYIEYENIVSSSHLSSTNLLFESSSCIASGSTCDLKTQSCTSISNPEEFLLSQTLTSYHEPLNFKVPQSDLNPCAPPFYIDKDVENLSVHLNQNSTNSTSSQNISAQHSNSDKSLSRTSCYQSFSSNLSDFQSAFSCIDDNIQVSVISQNESQSSVIPEPSKKTVSPQTFILPTKTTAILSHIEDPGNFWMQLESSKAIVPSFPKESFYNSPCPIHVESGDFCLAPSKSVPFYLRVKVVSEIQDQQTVKVLFIDHGSSQWVPLQELRMLPSDAFDIPMQVFNCYLAEISAPNNIWVFAAIRKLKEFRNNSIETYIKYQSGDKYGVQLIATISMFNEEFSCDIGQSLCYDGFAIENKVSEAETCTSSSALCEHEQNDSSPIINQLSCDSGVSVTSNRRLSPSGQHRLSSSENINALCIDDSSCPLRKESPVISEELQLDNINDSKSKIADLISFESMEKLPNDDTLESFQEQMTVNDTYNKCLKTCICECPLHLIIPFPSIKFVEANMVLVMLSHIDNPNEFYVNMAMESSTTLDELLEQMTNAYNTPSLQESNAILLDDLKEGTFCAAGFEDGYWYRVKILSIHLKFDQSPNVYVQYVDYGNKAWIKNSDLRTLTPEFAKHPAYSVKCSLAGIVPCSTVRQEEGESHIWSKDAIETLKNMLSFENCFTAEICDRMVILNNDPLQVLLWDTQSKEDVLINKTFVESGVAEFDLKMLQDLFNTQEKKNKDIEVLNHWNPMLDEYNSIENSYGVNVNDMEVVLHGYKHNDEEYTCKYFSLRGYCPRGRNCTFKHIPLAEGGVTRDLEELYAFDSHPPLPDDNSYVLVQVSAVYSPTYFYVIFPFGGINVNDLDSRINRGAARENLLNREVQGLYEALNDHYSNKPFDEKTTVALSYGTIVVAQRKFDKTWHRARVIDVQDIDGPAQLFYVDFGNEEWVDRRCIRQIIPEFLHIPFQAVECCLYDVEPLGFEQGQQWSANAISRFKNLVSEVVVLAHVAYRLNNVLHVSLRMTTENDHLSIKDHLIREGYGQDRNPVINKKQKTIYIPG